MPDVIPVVQLAKERALFRFSAMGVLMLQDATISVGQLSNASPGLHEQKTISQSKMFLQDQGQDFLKRLNTSYAGYVERGMQTMYRDLRQNLSDISVDTLALVDHDTVSRQIEVERRVLRLRDADQQSLGRLNLMIAKIHGEHDVRERENPFRPYLMARALHDVLSGMVATNHVCTLLFDHLSGALCNHLPEYFAAIRHVFESHGVHAQLLARPSALSRRDREALVAENKSAPNMLFNGNVPDNFLLPAIGGADAQNLSALSAPMLERVATLLEQELESSSPQFATVSGESALKDFVRNLLNRSVRSDATPKRTDDMALQVDAVPVLPQTEALLARLQHLQNKLLLATPASAASVDLHAALGLSVSSDSAGDASGRIEADVVAMLFAYIAQDEAIPDAFRTQIARLQPSFLKAALLDAGVLQSPLHPVRKLLNRLVSLSIGFADNREPGISVLAHVTDTIHRILRDFNHDVGLFDEELHRLNDRVRTLLRTTDAEVGFAAEALGEAEKDPEQYDVVLGHTIAALRERFATLQTDPRAEQFIVSIWSRVLTYVSQHGSMDPKPYLDTVSELIWSVQVNLDAGERAALMRLLPRLAIRLREGLALIEMDASESQRVLDELMAMHAQVLRSAPDPLKYSMRLGSLIQHFAKMRIGAPNETVAALHAPMIPAARLQSALKKFDVDARAYLDNDIGALGSEDAQWLANMLPGTSIEWWSTDAYLPATLMWVDEPQSFYLFHIASERRIEGQPGLLIYSSIALIKALREGSIGTKEAAPVFDRALQAVLLEGDDFRQPEPV